MLDLRQLRLSGGSRGEKIDTQRALLVAEGAAALRDRGWTVERMAHVLDVPSHNSVAFEDRVREMLLVWDYYPQDFLELAYRYPPPWHLLVEPTRWDGGEGEVAEYLGNHLERHGDWPNIGAARAAFGYHHNHRSAADKDPRQDSLEGLA